ncbi:hypothetical protein C8R47DRAFT_1127960 [Mycena vitilis]|nr:hypothetical protein C8R47DRAFT_1127960 [Mycena vitilis]
MLLHLRSLFSFAPLWTLRAGILDCVFRSSESDECLSAGQRRGGRSGLAHDRSSESRGASHSSRQFLQGRDFS